MKRTSTIMGILVALLVSPANATADEIPMSLEHFMEVAEANQARCIGEHTVCQAYHQDALEHNLIAPDAYDWGLDNRYYAIPDDTEMFVVLICRCA